jgi:3-hydroxyisobutyrate dehydrogenase-like beta-hydroxyacid dehydrogenase
VDISMPIPTSVGLIGLGLMGEVYARRLIEAGFGVIGFDIDAARNARLLQIGGSVASLADIARNRDPIVVAVF